MCTFIIFLKRIWAGLTKAAKWHNINVFTKHGCLIYFWNEMYSNLIKMWSYFFCLRTKMNQTYSLCINLFVVRAHSFAGWTPDCGQNVKPRLFCIVASNALIISQFICNNRVNHLIESVFAPTSKWYNSQKLPDRITTIIFISHQEHWNLFVSQLYSNIFSPSYHTSSNTTHSTINAVRKCVISKF